MKPASPDAHTAPEPFVLRVSALLGFGLLLTYNLLLNLIPFFGLELAWPDVAFFAALALTYPSLAVQLVMLTVGERVPAALRIRGALLTNAAALAAAVAAAGGGAGRAAVLLVLALSGVATAVLEASLFGFLSQLPRGGAACAQAAMTGAGAAGVAACLLQMALSAALAPAAAAIVYAALGVIVLLGCMAAHLALLLRLPPPTTTMTPATSTTHAGGPAAQTPAEGRPASPPAPFAGAEEGRGGSGARDEAPVVMLLSPVAAAGASASAAAAASAAGATAAAAGADPAVVDAWRTSSSGRASTPAAQWLRDMHRVGAGVALPCAAMFTQFVATFVAFPGLTAQVVFKGGAALAVPWFSILLLSFSVADVSGRALAGAHAPLPGGALASYAAARFLFTPLIAGCAFGWPGFGDAAAVFVMLAFGLTNGHCAALSMMGASRARLPESDKERAGFLLVATLHVGIVVGSNLALGFGSST